MKKIFRVFILFLSISLSIELIPKASENKDYLTEMKQDILSIMLAYPGYIKDLELKDSRVYLILKSGKKIIYDDKKEKSPNEKLNNPDIQDMLEQVYPLDKTDTISKEFNPGRIRHYGLLNEVYGSSKTSIEKNLINLKYGYPNYQFNKQNNANKSLENALREAINLGKTRTDINNILYPASGTYNYRVISGTSRLSPHSYGIAIDLKRDDRDYWKWTSKENGEKRLSEYPRGLVKIFEDNNFIWGGKWGYFDILHFEYRPEIILKAKYFANNNSSDNWFEGVPLTDENKNYISLIEDKLNNTTTFSKLLEDDLNKTDNNSLENMPSKEEMNELVKNIFLTRSKGTLTKDLKGIESLYDTSTKYGKWAYEYEEKKVKYIDNWAKKQGVEFTLIKPKILIKKSTIKKDEASFAIICNTEYNYVYKDIPKEINKSKIGTYHYLKIVRKNNKWSIVKEWYKDPFADSLKLESLKTNDITKYINNQVPRNLSNLNEKRKGAIAYAKEYCGLAHDTKLGLIYNKNYRDFNAEGGDCANFASQILYEGGKFSKNRTWNYDEKGSATAPWINAGTFTNYMLYSGRASLIARGTYENVYKLSFKLLPGDFVAYEKKGDITHVSVVTGLDSKGYPLVTCHNTDRNDVPWDLGWSDKNMKFWIIRVHY